MDTIKDILEIRQAIPLIKRNHFDRIVEQVMRYESDLAQRNLALGLNFAMKVDIARIDGRLVTTDDLVHMFDRLARYAEENKKPFPAKDTDPRKFAHDLQQYALYGMPVKNELGMGYREMISHMLPKSNKQRDIDNTIRTVQSCMATVMKLPGTHACEKYRTMVATSDRELLNASNDYQAHEHQASLALRTLNSTVAAASGIVLFEGTIIGQTGDISQSPSPVTKISQGIVDTFVRMVMDEHGKPE